MQACSHHHYALERHFVGKELPLGEQISGPVKLRREAACFQQAPALSALHLQISQLLPPLHWPGDKHVLELAIVLDGSINGSGLASKLGISAAHLCEQQVDGGGVACRDFLLLRFVKRHAKI